MVHDDFYFLFSILEDIFRLCTGLRIAVYRTYTHLSNSLEITTTIYPVYKLYLNLNLVKMHLFITFAPQKRSL